MLQLARGPVRPPARDAVSVDALEALRAAIEQQIAELDPGEVELGFINMEDVARWQTQYGEQLAALRAALGEAGHGDDHALSGAAIEARATPLAEAFRAALIRLANLRRVLNESFREYRTYREGQEASESALAEMSAIGKQKALEAKIAASERGGEASSSSAAAEEKATAFPHKGKHAPPRSLVENIGGLEDATAGRGQTALYITNDPPTVVGWEDTARAEGLTLHDGFTIVHRFGHVVGADQGSRTQCVRIDGDHGHPIIEAGSKTSFDSYVQRDIAHYVEQGDHEALKRIARYLQSIGLDPRGYGVPDEDIE